jgi:hypothetical protein
MEVNMDNNRWFGFALLLGLFFSCCSMPPKPATVAELALLKQYVGRSIVWQGKPVGDKGRWFLKTNIGVVAVDRAWEFESGKQPFSPGSTVTIQADVQLIEGYTVGPLPPGLQTYLREGDHVPAHYLLINVRVLEVGGNKRASAIRLASPADL